MGNECSACGNCQKAEKLTEFQTQIDKNVNALAITKFFIPLIKLTPKSNNASKSMKRCPRKVV